MRILYNGGPWPSKTVWGACNACCLLDHFRKHEIGGYDGDTLEDKVSCEKALREETFCNFANCGKCARCQFPHDGDCRCRHCTQTNNASKSAISQNESPPEHARPEPQTPRLLRRSAARNTNMPHDVVRRVHSESDIPSGDTIMVSDESQTSIDRFLQPIDPFAPPQSQRQPPQAPTPTHPSIDPEIAQLCSETTRTARFRFSAKKLGLTYPCPKYGACATRPEGHEDGCTCENPIQSKQHLADFLTQLAPDSNYYVAEERHKSGKLHYHAFVFWTDKKNYTDCRRFDYTGTGGCVAHANILVPRSIKAWKKYVTKGKNYISNCEEQSCWKLAMSAASARDAVQSVFESDPKEGVIHSTQIAATWTTLNSAPPKTYGALPFPWKQKYIDECPKLGRTLQEMIDAGVPESDYRKRFTLIMQGPAGTGKTQFALRMYKRPLLVRHLDQLRDANLGIIDCIVFDDISFRHMPREAQIHLCDGEEDTTVHCRYKNPVIPAGLPRIMTCNVAPQYTDSGEQVFLPNGEPANKHCPVDRTEETGAIESRIIVWDITESMIDKP